MCPGIVGHADVDPRELTANPANWRRHPKAQAEALEGALGAVGWVATIMVNRRSGLVVDGHLRLERAIARHETTVPVTYVDLDEREEALILATLDPLDAMATTDQAALDALLSDVRVDDEWLDALLDDLRSPVQGLVDPDEVPPVPAEPWVKAGELFALGQHRLLCGDSTKVEEVARLLGGATPRLLVTDPPYGVSLDPRWRDGVYNALGPAETPYMRVDGQPEAQDATRAPRARHVRTQGHTNATLSGDTRVDWSSAFALVPSLAVGYVWHAGVHAAEVAEGLIRIGFEIVAQVIWDKGLFAMGRSWYHWRHEPCWVVRKPGVPNLFIGERNQSTVWEAPSPKMIMSGSKEEKFDHPAQKPVAVIEPSIRNHRGDVYDPFVGSGTTIIAAEQLGRRCYAMEIDPRYVQVAIERWQAFAGRTAERIDG